MFVAAFTVVLLSNIIFSMQNRKKSWAVLGVTYIAFVFVFSGNSSSGDIPNYLTIYNNIDYYIHSTPLSAVFYFIMKLAKDIGLNFFQFKIIIGIPTYYLYYRFVDKIGVNVHYVIVFYILHLFILDVEQIRNALALAVFLQGFIPLYKNEKDQIKTYVFYTLLASIIHISFVFYLILIFYRITWSSTFRKTFIGAIILLLILSAFNGNKIPFLDFVLHNFNVGGKVNVYFGNKMRFGFIVPLVLHLVLFFYMWYIRKQTYLNNKYNDIVEKTYRLIVLSFAFIPLYMLSITFGRYARNMIPLVLVAAASVSSEFRPKSVSRWKLTSGLFLMMSPWILYDIIMRPTDILIPIIKYNYFINGGIY